MQAKNSLTHLSVKKCNIHVHTMVKKTFSSQAMSFVPHSKRFFAYSVNETHALRLIIATCRPERRANVKRRENGGDTIIILLGLILSTKDCSFICSSS